MLENSIRSIYTPDIVGVTPDTPVSEAVSAMRGRGVSCIVALEGRRPIGIFTERNIVQCAVHGSSFLGRPLREVMTSPVLTADEDMLTYEAYNILASSRIRHLVVVDGQGEAIGVVTQSNMIHSLGFEYFVEVKKVSQIMSGLVATVDPAAPVSKALETMAVNAYSCIVAERDRRPAGILTERDVARLVLEREDLSTATVAEVMSRPIRSVPMDASVYEAAMLMREKSVRRLVVLGEDGQVRGLVTQSDIVRGLESRYIGILRRVLREKNLQLREAMEDSAQKSLFLDNILNSAVDIGLAATDIDLRVTYFNGVAEQITDCRAEDVLGRNVNDMPHGLGLDGQRFEDAIEAVRTEGSHSFSFERVTAAGSIMYVDARVSGIRDRRNSLLGYVITLRDVTERKSAEETIRHLAYHDVLTGLPNRALVTDRLNRAMALARRNNRVLALLMLDLDRFKQVNDTLGHTVGDQLLHEVGQRLSSILRQSDTVARMGGDEFLILLTEIQYPTDAVVVAEKVLDAVSQPYLSGGRSIEVTTSIGIAAYPVHGLDIDTLMKKADSAMYKAKDSGRNSYAFSD